MFATLSQKLCVNEDDDNVVDSDDDDDDVDDDDVDDDEKKRIDDLFLPAGVMHFVASDSLLRGSRRDLDKNIKSFFVSTF